jgi:hypothetical protein
VWRRDWLTGFWNACGLKASCPAQLSLMLPEKVRLCNAHEHTTMTPMSKWLQRAQAADNKMVISDWLGPLSWWSRFGVWQRPLKDWQTWASCS